MMEDFPVKRVDASLPEWVEAIPIQPHCPKCLGGVLKQENVELTTYPPKSLWRCNFCNHLQVGLTEDKQ